MHDLLDNFQSYLLEYGLLPQCMVLEPIINTNILLRLRNLRITIEPIIACYLDLDLNVLTWSLHSLWQTISQSWHLKNIFPNLILFPHGLHFSVTFTLFWIKECCLEGTLAALLNVRFTGVITLVGVFGGSPMSKIE